MAPTDNDIAVGGLVAVIPEIPALELELDSHSLPFVRSDLPLRLAIGVFRARIVAVPTSPCHETLLLN